jgi:hypothetical protein
MYLSEELSERLAKLEQEQLRQQEEVEAMHSFAFFSSVSTTPPPKVKPLQTNKSSAKKSGKGYKIRLEFSNDSPASEWSEDTRGWRSRGQGSCYPDEATVQQKFQELKQRWPDYPLSVYAVE